MGNSHTVPILIVSVSLGFRPHPNAIDPSTFSTCHTPGETVGQGLPGTGQMGAPDGENKVDQAIAWGMKNHGLVPGQNLRYIQFAGGKTYFYAAGGSSGNAGSDCHRMDPR